MQEKGKKVLVIATILSMVLLITAATVLFAQINSPATTLYVDPSAYEDPTILPNDTIGVRIMLTDAVNLKICEFNLTFSPSVLSVRSINKFKVGGQYPQSSMDIDDVAGYVWAKLTYGTPVTIVSNTSLVEIIFNVKDFGSTTLHFASSTLTDNLGNPITHDTSDGFVHIFRRNIVVQSIGLPYDETYVGRLIPINVTVYNDGDITENFTVSLFYDTTLIAAQNVVNLASKDTVVLAYDWNISAVPASAAPYTFKAEATILPHETNTTDNTLVGGTIKLKIVGDVDGDGVVDIGDLTAWDSAYLSQQGDLNWNAQADINYDGVVDKADATLILDHYRETL